MNRLVVHCVQLISYSNHLELQPIYLILLHKISPVKTNLIGLLLLLVSTIRSHNTIPSRTRTSWTKLRRRNIDYNKTKKDS